MSAMPELVANRSAASSINFSSYLIIYNSFKGLERKIGGKLTPRPVSSASRCSQEGKALWSARRLDVPPHDPRHFGLQKRFNNLR
jgi:hypothetical protein